MISITDILRSVPFVWCLAVVMFFAARTGAFAAPEITSVEGTLAGGRSVTIAGTGFGAKAVAEPILWAPFDADKSPSTLGRITAWAVETSCQNHSADYGLGDGGGMRTVLNCSTSNHAELAVNTGVLSVQLNSYNAKMYMFRNRKPVTETGSNHKSLEFNRYPADSYYGDCDLIYNYSSNQWITQGMDTTAYFYADGKIPLGSWSSEELIAQTGATAGAQATLFEWWYNNTKTDITGGRNISLNGGQSDDIMTQAALLYHADYNAGAGNEVGDEYFDNLYLDNSWSRVMLGNASTYADSSIRVIMPATAWEDTSITVSFNQGSFTNGQTAYIYVFDSGNTVNAIGKAIAIAGDDIPSDTPPAAPTELKVE